jgi:flagellar motor switch protein FliN/FliY
MKNGQLKDMRIPLQVVLGEADVSVEELAALQPGTIMSLDQVAGEPVFLVAAGEVIARAEVVVIDENFGIRVTELVKKGG